MINDIVESCLLDLACLDNKFENDFVILYLVYFLLSIVICYV